MVLSTCVYSYRCRTVDRTRAFLHDLIDTSLMMDDYDSDNSMNLCKSYIVFTGLVSFLKCLRVGIAVLIYAAAAAESLQSCPTLCDPRDGSPPGAPFLGILQARTLESVAISFSNAWKWNVKVKSLSRVRLLATPWTAAYQAPPSMGFARFLSIDSLKELNKCAKRYGKQCEILNLSYVCACGTCVCVCL